METQGYLSSGNSVHLVVLENHRVHSFPLDARSNWQIGRITPVSSPDIPLESVIVGREHGELVYVDNEWYYIDKGSINGTYLNGEKIGNGGKEQSKLYLLQDGDVLRIDSNDLSHPDSRGIWMLFTTNLVGDVWENFPLNETKEVLIGRNEETCDIVLPFLYISREHARIGYGNGHYFLMDCNSNAGTWLNGKKIEHGEVLKEKDRISLCDCNLIFTGDELIYNIDEKRKRLDGNTGDVVLKADIKTKKVPNNNGIGEKELIKDVHVEIREGSLVALLGSSGAGKTTVMNCLNGMDTNGVEGSVHFKGVDLLTNFEQVKYLIGSVPQEEVFHPMLKVESELKDAAILRLPKDLKRKEIQQRVDETIRLLNLEQVRKNKICKCSGGEKKRVNIAIELVADRKLLCLDEPDAGLDPGMKKELFQILHNLAHDPENRRSILVIIHDVSDIDMFDQVIMMTKVDNVGRLAISGTPEEVRNHFGSDIKEAYQMLAENPEKYIKMYESGEE